RHYPLLLGLNAALAALLAALVIAQLMILARRHRARVFGARLTLRLLVRFAALAVVPGLIVYAVSVVFITRSIESWFDVKVDAALEGGINLGQRVIEQMTGDLEAKANAMALDLADRSQPQRAGPACAQRGGGRGRVSRLPGAGDLARRIEARVYRDAEFCAADGPVRGGG